MNPEPIIVPTASAAKAASPARPAVARERWVMAGICVLLAGLVWLVFGQTIRFGFVNCDDALYVFENAKVLEGLSVEGIASAFTHFDAHFYHPLTMVSLMLDAQLHGLEPGGYHLTNVLLHSASAVLLFLALHRMTRSTGPGALWRSALCAAVFAVHPLRVESVAWVAERKDVLSGVFFMLTLWAYARYAPGRGRVARVEGRGSSVEGRGSSVEGREPAQAQGADPESRHASADSGLAFDSRHSTFDHALVLIFFTLGLLAKPVAVTLPFVLLLLDYWPLGRFTAAELRIGVRPFRFAVWPLVREKLPLFMLAAAACFVAVFAQGEAVTSIGSTSLPLRIGNAVVSYAAYATQTFWPAHLAVYYPYPVDGIPFWQVAVSLVLLAVASIACLVAGRTRPYLAVGWLWYLGMLVPMIGIVQVGMFARADRFTYLPQIGLLLMLVWAMADLCASGRRRAVVLGALGAGIVLALAVCARVQATHWRDSESLWRRALACTSANAVAHNNLGLALYPKGSADEALAHFRKALRIKPDYVEARYNLGTALLESGRADEAIAEFQRVLALQPDDPETHNNLGTALLRQGKPDQALAHLQQALALEPGNPEIQNNLAWLLATTPQPALRNGRKAIELAEQAQRSTHGANPVVLHTLAAACAEAGQFDDAVRHVTRAIELAEAAGQSELADQFKRELKGYAAGQAYREERE